MPVQGIAALVADVEQAERYQLALRRDHVDAASLPALHLSRPSILECHGGYGQVMGLGTVHEGLPAAILGLGLPSHGLIDEAPE